MTQRLLNLVNHIDTENKAKGGRFANTEIFFSLVNYVWQLKSWNLRQNLKKPTLHQFNKAIDPSAFFFIREQWHTKSRVSYYDRVDVHESNQNNISTKVQNARR